MTPNHHMLLTVAQLDLERRNRALERRRLVWETRRQAKQDQEGRGSTSWNPVAAGRALAALIGGLVRTNRRSPAALPVAADSDLRR